MEPNRIRKSLSVEQTFEHDINSMDACAELLDNLYFQLLKRLEALSPGLIIKNQYVKVKFSNFKQMTMERMSGEVNLTHYKNLLLCISRRECNKPVRLLGIGVHFAYNEKSQPFKQLTLL